MARRRSKKQAQSVDLFPIVLLLLLGLGISVYKLQYDMMLIILILVLIFVLVGAAVFLFERAKKERLSRSGIAEIDQMSGLDFEKYLQTLLLRRGYSRVTLTNTYDLGVDLIAHKDGFVWAIQAKRYKGAVGLDSVRQVVAAMNHYKCDKAMVITNSHFTNNAKVIARSTNCLLVDREALIELILQGSPDLVQS